MYDYNYERVYGMFTFPTQSIANPEVAGEYLLPAFAARDQPPPTGAHEVACRRAEDGSVPSDGSGSWVVLPDYRNTQYWLPDGSVHSVQGPGSLPDNAIFIPKPAALPGFEVDWQSGAWVQVENHIGQTYWLADGSQHIMTDLGPLPAGALFAAPPPPPTLKQVKATQSSKISDACAAAIAAGFTSSALGAAFFYGGNDRDQENIARAAKFGGLIWCGDANDVWSQQTHTAAQAWLVDTDLWMHVQAQQTRYASRLEAIDAAASPAAVTAVVW
jgi:hypothetical protein